MGFVVVRLSFELAVNGCFTAIWWLLVGILFGCCLLLGVRGGVSMVTGSGSDFGFVCWKMEVGSVVDS